MTEIAISRHPEPDRRPALSKALRASDLNIAITGATGWLGRATLDLLDVALGSEIGTRVRAFSSQARVIPLRSGHRMESAPLNALAQLPRGGRYLLLHFAFRTKDSLQRSTWDQFVTANARIRETVLSAAETLKLAGFVLPSSGAVYRKDGTLETDAQSNPYGFEKLRDEDQFASLCRRIDCPLTIARVFNLAGPHINKVQTYAVSSILLGALREGHVTLRSAHPVVRSYVDVRDMLEISLRTFFDLRREPLVCFETAGEREVEIGELAELVRDNVVGGPVRIDRPPPVADPVDRYVGDPTVLRRLARDYDVRLSPLVDQLRDTAAFLSESSDPLGRSD